MRLSNADLAAALRQQHPDDNIMRAFAQVLLQRPTSRALNHIALRALDLPPLPDESWAVPLPPLPDAEKQLSAAIADMNAGYHKTPYHAEVLARRVAWAAMTVARLHEWTREGATREAVQGGAFTPSDYNNKPLNSAEGRAAVIEDVTRVIHERNGQR